MSFLCRLPSGKLIPCCTQYYVRGSGGSTLGSPYAAASWSEARTVGAEMAELTPTITKQETLADLGALSSRTGAGSLAYRLFAEKEHHSLIAIVANTENNPKEFSLKLPSRLFADSHPQVNASVLFQDRSIPLLKQTDSSNSDVSTFVLTDVLLGFGTAAYRLPCTPPTSFSTPPVAVISRPHNLVCTSHAVHINDASLIVMYAVRFLAQVVNPSFEQATSPGASDGIFYQYNCLSASRADGSASCADAGATAVTDARLAYDGRHSLRLITPSLLGGVTLSPYEVRTTYRVYNRLKLVAHMPLLDAGSL
eukprot:SAG31_NODE_895_length_11169_cov_3.114182_7_plen_309_part_00